MVVSVVAYADGNQLVDWLSGTEFADEVPEGVPLQRLLLRASEVIFDATVGQVTFDDDDLPEAMTTPLDPPVTVGELRAAYADAVCAQVEQWCEVGESNDIAGWGAGTKLQLSAGAVTSLPDQLAPRAARRLARVGLTIGASSDTTSRAAPTVELV